MRNRVGRSIVVVLLLAVGAGAVVAGWSAARDNAAASRAQAAVDGRIDALLASLAELGTIEAGYVAPGQNPVDWLQRFPLVLRQVSAGPAAIGSDLRSGDASRALQAFADGTSRFAQADARARDSLLLGDALTASHIIFGEAREDLASMTAALAQVRAAEASARAMDRAQRSRQAAVSGAGAGAAWIVGLLVFALVPLSRPPSADGAAIQPPRADAPPDAALVPPPVAAAPRAAVDLAAAADLCTDIARVESAAALATLLDRAASLLDATGVIVWLGAGDQLFAVSAHGYDPGTVGRFGPLPRNGDSAASTAWRLGEIQVVRGDADSPGAIAAPMFGRDACSGVFAVEFREGRETDLSTRAVVTMITAQLASIMPGWPAASAAPADARATG